MKYFVSIILLLLNLEAISVQKPSIYKDDINITGWMMSEKLDGVRAYWDGKQLLTKNGNPIHAPVWFIKDLPPFTLDGELWSDRGQFEKIQSIVLDKVPSKEWQQISYHIFEVPHVEGDFLHRLQKLKSWLSKNPVKHVKVIEQILCKGKYHLAQYKKEIEFLGGEGVIIKDPKLFYHTGRSKHIYKVKKIEDAEAYVIGINPGKGKYKNMMGSLTVVNNDGIKFNIGTGFSDIHRQHPPSIGTMITYSYRGYTKNNKPRFPVFLHIREIE